MEESSVARILAIVGAVEAIEKGESGSGEPKAVEAGRPVYRSRLTWLRGWPRHTPVRLEGPGVLDELHAVMPCSYRVRVTTDGNMLLEDSFENLEAQSEYLEFLSAYRDDQGYHLVLRDLHFTRTLEVLFDADCEITAGYARWRVITGRVVPLE